MKLTTVYVPCISWHITHCYALVLSFLYCLILKNKNMPKYNVIYYLKRHHSPLITGRKAGARVQVKLILSDSIIANYMDEEPFGTVQCMKHEFHKIFCRNKSLIYK